MSLRVEAAGRVGGGGGAEGEEALAVVVDREGDAEGLEGRERPRIPEDENEGGVNEVRRVI